MKTLLIKLGAMGDVLRTTPLLHVLDGDVYWVTRKEAISLLPNNNLKQIIDIEKAKTFLQNKIFDLVISLDDDYEGAELATIANKRELIGSFLNNKKITYTESSAEWFDLGLISKYGKNIADELKKRNTKTYQEIVFKMLGKVFNGEEYIIRCGYSRKNNCKMNKIGIESRAGDRWPTKRWNKYDQLANLLNNDGFDIKFFKQCENLSEYIDDISECDLVISGDTLALHIALALKIPIVGIFICTSPTEIYGYNRMIKVVSPLLDKAFYKKEYVREAVEAVTLNEVYEAVMKLIMREL